jgi:hypothetical protein
MTNYVSTIQIRLYPDGRMCAKDASDYVGLSDKTLAMMRCKGTGPRFIKRGRIFYFKTDLDEWLSKGSATSTAQCGKQNG